MIDQTLNTPSDWKQYWPLVLAAAIGFSFHSLMTVFAGLYMQPMSEELGWSRTEFTIGLSVAAIISTIASPFFGVLIDRLGTRRLALPGIMLTSVAIASIALMTSSIMHWLAIWVIFSFVSLAIKSTIWTAAVSGVFDKGRGLALGVVMAGNALTQIIVPPLGNWLIAEYGWRAAFVWLGFGWGSFAFLLCFLFFYDVHDKWRQKNGAASNEKIKKIELQGLTLGEAVYDRSLMRIAASTFITMFFTVTFIVHLFPILTEAGVPRVTAAWYMSLSGIAAIFGKTITGYLLDRLNPSWVGAITLCMGGLAFALLMEGVRTTPLIILAIIINGYTGGTKLQICAYLTSRYAGMKNYGVIFGVMTSLIALGSGLGPVIGGMVYDAYGNYSQFLWAGLIGSVISGVIIFGLADYPDWKNKN